MCCGGGQVGASSGDLPSRVRGFLQGVMQRAPVRQQVEIPSVVERPPVYVLATIHNEGDYADPNDENLAGVMVIVGNDG